MKIVMAITGAHLPADALDTVGRELIAVVRQHAAAALAEETGQRAHVHVEAFTCSAPTDPPDREVPCSAAPPSTSPTASPSASSGSSEATPTTAPTPPAPCPSSSPRSMPPSSGGPRRPAADSSELSPPSTPEPSPASEPRTASGAWDDISGDIDSAAVARLVRDGGPGYATGADLHAAALDLDDDDSASYSSSDISEHLGVPLVVVRRWLREDR